jgi:urease accessory protein
MRRIEHVLGSRLEPDMSEALHRLEHRGAVDISPCRRPISPAAGC